MRYIPTTEKDREAMLKSLGISSIEELFNDIPEEVRFRGELNLPPPQSEIEVLNSLRALAQKMPTWIDILLF